MTGLKETDDGVGQLARGVAGQAGDARRSRGVLPVHDGERGRLVFESKPLLANPFTREVLAGAQRALGPGAVTLVCTMGVASVSLRFGPGIMVAAWYNYLFLPSSTVVTAAIRPHG